MLNQRLKIITAKVDRTGLLQKTNCKMFEITYDIDGFIQAGFVYAQNPNEAKNNFNSYVYKHTDQYGEWSTIEIIDIQERKEK